MKRKAFAESNILGFLNPKLARQVSFIPKISVIVVVALGALDLVGWQFHITLLKSISPAFIAMKANTAVCLILSAMALHFHLSPPKASMKYRLPEALSVIVSLIGAATLMECAFGWNFGIDTFLFTEPMGATGTLMPGRMEPITAINLFLLGLALFSMSSKHEGKRHPPSHILAFMITVISLLPLVAYLFGAQFTLGVGSACAMAPHTALSFLLLSFSILVAHPNHDLAAILISDGPGGFMARRILPAAILIPLALGLTRVLGERFDVVSAEFGTALFTTLTIAGFGTLIWFQSLVLQRTELKRRLVQRRRDALNLQGKLRDQFVSMLSHDLRNPVSVATGYAQLLLEECQDESSRDDAMKILKSLSRVDRMIRDLLDVSRIRAGHTFQLQVADCDLVDLIRTTLSELEVVHGDRFRLESGPEIHGKWDPIALRRAVENICNNAVKYGATDSPITVRVFRFKDRVRISVHNLGKPIPPEEQKTLFSPFQRASTSTERFQKGWGLGLTLVRGIVEAHGGRIFVESSAESGTRFTIDLPQSGKNAVNHKNAS